MSKWLVDIHGEIEGDFDLICKAENTIPLDKVKQAIEKIENACEDFDGYDTQALGDYACKVGEILNKLIESEGNNE